MSTIVVLNTIGTVKDRNSSLEDRKPRLPRSMSLALVINGVTCGDPHLVRTRLFTHPVSRLQEHLPRCLSTGERVSFYSTGRMVMGA